MNLADWLRKPRPSLGEQLSLVAALARAVEEGHRAGRQYDGWAPAHIEWDGSSINLRALDVTAHPSPDLVYAAPETADGAPPTLRSDVYSAGVILYEILAGSHPFGGASVKQPRGIARPLSEARRDIPQELADAVTACLERDPDWRPADLSYVLQVAGEAAAKSGGKKAPKAAPAPATAPRGATPRGGATERPMFGARSTPAPSRSRLPVLLAGVLVAISAGVAYWTFGRSGGTSPVSRPTVAPPVAATPTTSIPAATDVAAASPSPTTAKTAAPQVAATSAAAALATHTTIATSAPTVVTAAPAATRATAEPVVTRAAVVQTEAPTAAPATPEPIPDAATLTSLSPLKIKRGANALLDVHGENLTAQHVVAVARTKGKFDVTDVVVLRTKLANPTLLQVLVSVAANAPTGAYTLSVSDPRSRLSNALAFEIIQ